MLLETLTHVRAVHKLVLPCVLRPLLSLLATVLTWQVQEMLLARSARVTRGRRSGSVPKGHGACA